MVTETHKVRKAEEIDDRKAKRAKPARELEQAEGGKERDTNGLGRIDIFRIDPAASPLDPIHKEGSGWVTWPWSAEEELVLEWLQDLMKHFTAWINESGVNAAPHRRIYQGPGIYLDGSPVKRKMDVGIRHAIDKAKVTRTESTRSL
ncbi:hypothetical protein MMC30_007328 [Trapelia coarctata]|nr:hypothetical protein [Trapelia coarctata]